MIKGENVVIGKQAELDLITVDIKWRISSTSLKVFEIDAVAFLLKDDNLVRDDHDFIFYNDLEDNKNKFIKHVWQKIKHNSNNEKFQVNLKDVPTEIEKIVFGLSIYKATERGQNFNHLRNLEIDLIKDEGCLVKYELEYNEESINSMILGEIYRHKENWKFRAVNQGFLGDIKELEQYFGVNC